jgi:hypothetical protein
MEQHQSCNHKQSPCRISTALRTNKMQHLIIFTLIFAGLAAARCGCPDCSTCALDKWWRCIKSCPKAHNGKPQPRSRTLDSFQYANRLLDLLAEVGFDPAVAFAYCVVDNANRFGDTNDFTDGTRAALEALKGDSAALSSPSEIDKLGEQVIRTCADRLRDLISD